MAARGAENPPETAGAVEVLQETAGAVEVLMHGGASGEAGRLLRTTSANMDVRSPVVSSRPLGPQASMQCTWLRFLICPAACYYTGEASMLLAPIAHVFGCFSCPHFVV